MIPSLELAEQAARMIEDGVPMEAIPKALYIDRGRFDRWMTAGQLDMESGRTDTDEAIFYKTLNDAQVRIWRTASKTAKEMAMNTKLNIGDAPRKQLLEMFMKACYPFYRGEETVSQDVPPSVRAIHDMLEELREAGGIGE